MIAWWACASTRYGSASSASMHAGQQVPAVEVVVRRPLEQLGAGLVERPVVVRGGADVDRLPEVADPRVLGQVLPADLLRAVGRGVVGDDQVEVAVALPQQGVQGLREVLLAVVDRKADTQPRLRVHVLLISGISCRSTAAAGSDSSSASSCLRSRTPIRSVNHQTKAAQNVAHAAPQADPLCATDHTAGDAADQVERRGAQLRPQTAPGDPERAQAGRGAGVEPGVRHRQSCRQQQC